MDAFALLKCMLPLIVLVPGIIYLVLRRQWEPETQVPPKHYLLTATQQINYYKSLQMTLSGISMVGWTYYTLPLQEELVKSLQCIGYFLAWVLILVTIAVSPPYYLYTARHYIHFCVFYYGYFAIDAGFQLYLSDLEESVWEIINFGLCLFLFIIAGNTPQPVHPWNLSEQVCCEGHKICVSPEASASVFSWAMFQWVNPLVRYGFSNPITRDDLFTLTYQHRARFAHASFTKAAKNGIRILHRLYKANRKSIWIQIIFSNMAVVLSYCNPYLQQLFLEYIEKKDRPIHIAYGYVFAMFLAAMARTLCSSVQLWVGRRWNIRTLCILDAEIYAKALRRKGACATVVQKDENGNGDKVDNNSIGKIANLMSIDADHIADFPAYIYMFYNGPIEMTIAIVYLYYLLGSAALVGLAVLFLFFPVTYGLVKWVRKAYLQLSQAEDHRNHLINELLQGIRIIKYAAWESSWQKKIMAARMTELKQVRRTFILDIMMTVGYMTMPVLVSACSFIWYVKVCQHELSASVVFVSITLFDMLRSPIMLIPDGISVFTEAYISLMRISSYLEDPEVDDPSLQEPGPTRVGFEVSTFQWPSKSAANHPSQETAGDKDKGERDSLLPRDNGSTLQYATLSAPTFQLHIPSAFNFPPGQLSLIHGPTGSGKSSILHALLGEMDKVKGRAYLPLLGFSRKSLCEDWKADIEEEDEEALHNQVSSVMSNVVAYAAQQPFLQQATIRENILFGQPYEAERYRKVLWQCALVKDLSILPGGDQTEIGEKGISLSGGQKQRVSLARAVYSYAKVALIDDCLSAVDAHTARHIFEHCIRGSLLQGRTVIMVTHHLQLCLPEAKFLVRLEIGGTVADYGPMKGSRQTDQLAEIIKTSVQADATQNSKMMKDKYEDRDIMVEQKEATAIRKLIQDEQLEKGHVKIKVHLAYLRACGGWLFWIALAVFFCASRSLIFAENWWLRIWAAAYSSNTSHTPYPVNSTLYNQASSSFTDIRLQISLYATSAHEYTQENTVDANYYITIYLIFCLSFVICDALRSILLFWGSIRGAKALFSQLLDRITHAPLRFFDTTPCGRILNRFGSDMSVVDMQMARTAGLLIECLTGMVASSVIISAITPEFIFVAVVTALTYIVIGVFYLRSSRELKRLNSVNRSPIYSHFTETLSGVTTIRAFGQQRKFLSSMYEKIDSYLSPYYLLWMVNRWLLIRMEAAGALMSMAAGILILHNLDTVDAGMAGISLVYAHTFLVHVYWMIRQYTQVEINMNSVERIQEYLELDQEPRNQPSSPPNWLEKTTLRIRNLHIRYAPHLDPVLQGVSFDVKDKEKIGIVGRTGSGKSTLALSLFRILEASEGDIILDGVNIANIDLKSLRLRMTMIPQDAALFSGTVRSNLDPFNERSDNEIWTALARVHLQSMIQSLDQSVSDGGQNFSQGQRQLLCMSRALLRSSKLIVMDEATASVDFDMDCKIQHTIRQAFEDSTLICVAHRLRTVIDYDRVLLMDQGRVIEFDSPWELLNRKPASAFHAMCEQSGELPELLEMARLAEEVRKRSSSSS